jgi:hypothetical protein
MAYPLPGALLPYNRIIAFTEIYIQQGWNLREIPREMIKNYREVAKWQAADSTTTATLLYIATVQGAPGRDNMYRMRMPFKQIDTVLSENPSMLWCLDIQVAHSTVKTELVKYLSPSSFRHRS